MDESFSKQNNIKKDHIERNAFWYERSFLGEVIEGIQSAKFNTETIALIPDFYLSMIVRNPMFRNTLDEKVMEDLIKTEMSKVRTKTKLLIKKINKPEWQEIFLTHVENIEKDMLSKNTKALIHNTSLFRQHNGESAEFSLLVSKLKGYKIIFAQIRNDENFFVTSNSPGFTLDLNNQIHSFKFESDFNHYMPISSKEVLILMHPAYNFKAPKIAIIEANSELVTFVNRSTMMTNNSEIYCEDRMTLENLINANNSK